MGGECGGKSEFFLTRCHVLYDRELSEIQLEMNWTIVLNGICVRTCVSASARVRERARARARVCVCVCAHARVCTHTYGSVSIFV